MSEIKRHLPKEYKPLEAKDFGRTVSDNDSAHQREMDLNAANDYVDYRNRLEEFPVQSMPIPETLSTNQSDLLERVQSDFDTYGMAIVSAEMDKDLEGVSDQLKKKQIALELAILEKSKQQSLELFQAGLITKEIFDEGLEELIDEAKLISKGKGIAQAFDVTTVIQELDAQPLRKIVIFADPQRWSIDSIVPRGVNKTDRARIATAHSEKVGMIPISGDLWTPQDYERKAKDSRIQPAIVVGKYSKPPSYSQ